MLQASRQRHRASHTHIRRISATRYTTSIEAYINICGYLCHFIKLNLNPVWFDCMNDATGTVITTDNSKSTLILIKGYWCWNNINKKKPTLKCRFNMNGLFRNESTTSNLLVNLKEVQKMKNVNSQSATR